MSKRTLDFSGPGYTRRLDQKRLTLQHERLRDLMLAVGGWWTLEGLAAETGYPQASISAQLRHLRKPQFGGYTVERRRGENEYSGLWLYRVLPPSTTPTAGQRRASVEIAELRTQVARLEARLAALEVER